MTKELAKITITAERQEGEGKLAQQLRETCDEFLDNNTALREINAQVDDIPEREGVPASFIRALDSLTDDQKREVEEFIGSFLELFRDMRDTADSGASIGERLVKEITTEDRAVVDTVVHFMQGMRYLKRPARRPIIRKSLLSVCISEYELLVGAVARFALRSHPESVEVSEATLSLAQLKSFKSIEHGVQYVIERRVDDLLRSDSKEWTKWFERFSIAYKSTVPDPAGYLEMNARRNVLVHNGGRVNEHYLRAVGDAQASEAAELTVDERYLDECLQRTSAMGLLLTYSTLLKLDSTDADGHTRWATSAIRKLLDDRQFQAARQSAEVVLQKTRGKLSRSDELDLQINAWVAMKELGEADEVVAAVERWDVSALTPYYRLCRAALLGDNERARRLLDDEIAQRRLSLVGAATHPLFAELLSAEEEHEALLLAQEEQETTADKDNEPEASNEALEPSSQPDEL